MFVAFELRANMLYENIMSGSNSIEEDDSCNMTWYQLWLLYLFPSQLALSQSAADVIVRHTAAIGGVDRIGGVKSLRFTGTVSSDSTTVPITIIIKGKDKIRMNVAVQGRDIIQGFDGTTGWFVNPFDPALGEKSQKMDTDDIKEIKELLEWEGQLVGWKKKQYTVELADKDNSDGYIIKLTNKSGEATFYYLDSASYLITKRLRTGEITEEMLPSNYKSIGGILFPMTLETKVSGPGNINSVTTTQYQNIELNIEVDDSIFKMP